jgi:hypothetical protein
MTQSRYGGGRGRTDGRAGRDGRGGAGRAGRGQGYPTKPKSTKVGLCRKRFNSMLVLSMARTSPTS